MNTLRKKLGLQIIQRRQYKVTTTSNPHQRYADNVLKQQFDIDKGNQVWILEYVLENE